MRANAKIEGFTILAILTGSLAGGMLADRSILLGMIVCILIYLLALTVSLSIPKGPRNADIRYLPETAQFFKDTAKLFRIRKTRFSLVGTGSFWMCSAVLRLALIAWVPVHLSIHSLDSISTLTAVTGIGIVFGALTAPRLVPAAKYYKAYLFGIAMAAAMLMFPFVYHTAVTVLLLLFIGFAGGVFIVPMNSALQAEGHKAVGAGKTIAVQNMIENALMMSGVGVYTGVSKLGVSTDASILGMTAVLLLMVAYLAAEVRRLRRERRSEAE
ncbi:hypothetical protein LJK88_09100 [Paenibacillus sp. P26]|nr:hypothetical protein LJK88_09100 [Paenibacillus sp. P26]UUZ97473.1 hypothetical protein LJK87_28475 [Paenibacillus sp. P25]